MFNSFSGNLTEGKPMMVRKSKTKNSNLSTGKNSGNTRNNLLVT